MVVISDKSPIEQTKEFYDMMMKDGLINKTNAVSVMCAEDSMLEEEAHKFSYRPENSGNPANFLYF